MRRLSGLGRIVALRGLVALVVGATLSVACDNAASPKSAADEKAGAQAADFTTRDIEGNTFRLSDHLGKKVILLDFWSTFCQPCMAEFPHLNRLYQENKAKGFVVVGISMDGPETVADVPSFAKRNGVTFPVVLDEDSRIASLYNPRKSAPLAVLIGKDGKVHAIREGYNPGDEEHLAADVAKVLDPAPASP
ncbi:MAG: TlpA disulfide reductase family protein [Polyangiaceae bacterium]